MKLTWMEAEQPLPRIDRGLPNVFPIPIQLQGQPAVVLFDTGASCSAVRRSVAEAAGLRPLHEQIAGGGSGLGRIQAEKWLAETVQIGPLTVTEQVWMVLPDACFVFELETGHPAQIDGLLGWDVLQFGCWQWDEKSQRLSGKPSLPEKSTIHELTGWDSMPVVQAETNGEILCWGFDSGNTSTTGGSLFYSRLPESLPLELETLTGVDGTTQVPAKRLARLPLRIGTAEMILSDVPVINKTLYPVRDQAVAGLLGADVLAGCSWRLDYPNRRLELKPEATNSNRPLRRV